MKEQIAKIENLAKEEILEAKDLTSLNDVRVKYLGKKGELTLVLRGMGGLSPEETIYEPLYKDVVLQAKEGLITVENRLKFEIDKDFVLPKTGGIGTSMITMSGLSLMILSIAYKIIDGRKKRGDG